MEGQNCKVSLLCREKQLGTLKCLSARIEDGYLEREEEGGRRRCLIKRMIDRKRKLYPLDSRFTHKAPV